MSKFIKKLRQVHQGTQPMGFRAASVAPSQHMLLIAALSQGNTRVKLTKTKIDAIVIDGQDLGQSIEGIQQIISRGEDIPYGLRAKAITEETLEQLKKAGGDFFIFGTSNTPATLLQEGKLGKILEIDINQDEGLISTINEFPVEAVLMELSGEGKTLSISDLMHCQWLVGLIEKPILIATQRELTSTDIKSLWGAGVSGLVVKVRNRQSLEKLTRLSQELKGLPVRKGRREKGPEVTRLDQGSAVLDET